MYRSKPPALAVLLQLVPAVLCQRSSSSSRKVVILHPSAGCPAVLQATKAKMGQELVGGAVKDRPSQVSLRPISRTMRLEIRDWMA